MFKKLFSGSQWPQLPIEEIRKRARLLVIDDQEFYYMPLFQSDGYNIEKWDDIEDLTKLEEGYYDIILLDIQGVGRKYTSDQGFGILKHLKKGNPVQMIVAYSNADWSLKYQEFFEMADAKLHKQRDYIDFKETVDQLLSERFSLGFYIQRIEIIAQSHITDTKKLQQIARTGILSKSTQKLSEYLSENIESKEAIKIILQIASVAIQTASMISAA